MKSKSEKSEETRGLGVKKDRGGPAGTEKSVFVCGGEPFFCGAHPVVGEAPKGGGPRETNKQTKENKQTKKPKHFFSFGKPRTSYVIRREEIVALFTYLHNKVKQASDQNDDDDDDGGDERCFGCDRGGTD